MDDFRRRMAHSRASLKDTTLPERVYNAAIMPEDADFRLMEETFESILKYPDATVGAILQEYFSEWDRDLFIPEVNCQTTADIQRRQTALFRAMSWRFEGHPITLATKLTMLWFGLPVEPMMYGAFGVFQHLMEDPDDQGLELVDARPPLHFLTAHDQRNFGRDARRGREAPFSTIPVPVSHLNGTTTAENPRLRLRGGELSADDGDDFDDDDDDEDEDVEMSEQAASHDLDAHQAMDVDTAGRASEFSESDDEGAVVDVHMEEGQEPPKDNRIPQDIEIRGFQGCVNIAPASRPQILGALRALLSLGPKDSCDMVLYLTAKSVATDLINRWTLPVPETAVEEAAAIVAAESSAETAWFVTRVGEEVPKDGLLPKSSDIMTISTSRAGVFRRAYVRLPARDKFFSGDKPRAFGVNDYMPFLQVAQDVLWGRPHYFRGAANHILQYTGHPSARPADEFGEHDEPSKGPSKKNETRFYGWYGGLEVDDDLLRMAYAGDRKGHKVPMSVERHQIPPRHAAFLVPGLKMARGGPLSVISRPGMDHKAGKALKNLYNYAFPKKNVTMFYLFHGTSFYNPYPNLLDDVFGWDPNETDKDAIEAASTKLDSWIRVTRGERPERGSYYIVKPLYGDAKPRADFEGSFSSLRESKHGDKIKFPETMKTIKDFRALIEKVHKGSIDWKNACVVLSTRHRDDKKWSPRSFVVGPRTRNGDFIIIRRSLVSKYITFSVEGSGVNNDFVKSIASSSKTVFGPRYDYVLPLRLHMGLDELPYPDSTLMTGLREEHQAKASAKAAAVDEKVSEDLASQGIKPLKGRSAGASENAEQTNLFSKPSTRPKANNIREASWSRPLSIFDDGSYNPSIPIAAPPIEKLLRVGKNTNVPTVSLSVLTPTEQVSLQKQVHELRNLNLNRIHYCQFEDCNFSYEVADKQAILDHHAQHVTFRCPWCDDVIFEHFDEASRDVHFKEKHPDKVQRLANDIVQTTVEKHPFNRKNEPEPVTHTQRDNLSTLYSKLHPRPDPVVTALEAPARAHKLEQEYNFCDRCGRDHSYLNDEYDRDVHDRLCVPHAEGAGCYDFCERCGLPDWKTEESRDMWEATAPFPHKCKGFNHPGGPYCTECGLAFLSLPDQYVDTHRKFCNGFRSEVASFCPYCQDCLIDKHESDHNELIENKRFHITACRRRHLEGGGGLVAGDMTPFDLYQEGYWGEIKPPHDALYHGLPKETIFNLQSFKPSRALTNNLKWYDRKGPKAVRDPPEVCPHDKCRAPLFGLRPAQVLEHFEMTHGGQLDKCPFCEASFVIPREARMDKTVLFSRETQVLHFECHVFRLWDDLLANNTLPQRTAGPVPPGHHLYDPFDEGMAPNQKRCPYFADCGAVVGYMTDEQWQHHNEKNHGGATQGLPLQAALAAEVERRRRQEAQILDAQEEPRQTQHREKATVSTQAGSGKTQTPAQTSTKQPVALQTPVTQPPKATLPRSPFSQTPQITVTGPGTSAKKTPGQGGLVGGAKPAIPTPLAQEHTGGLKTPVKPVAPPASNVPASDTGTGENPPRPSSTQQLVVPEDLYVPKGAAWCSRCMRKAPSNYKGRPKAEPSIKHQIAAHVSGSRSCRINNGPGSIYDEDGNVSLPNQSGWISQKEIAGVITSLPQEGKKWAMNHKSYRKTIYPAHDDAKNKALWAWDPNHEDYRDTWGLPFPPTEPDPYGDESMAGTNFFNTEDEGEEPEAVASGWSLMASSSKNGSSYDTISDALDVLLKTPKRKKDDVADPLLSSSGQDTPDSPVVKPPTSAGFFPKPKKKGDAPASTTSSTSEDSDPDAQVTTGELSDIGLSDGTPSGRSRRKRQRDGTYKPTKADLAQEKKDYQDDVGVEDAEEEDDGQKNPKKKKAEKTEQVVTKGSSSKKGSAGKKGKAKRGGAK